MSRLRLVIIIVTAFFACCTLLPLHAAKKLKIGIYQNPPKIFVDKQGQPAGIFVDIIKHIANVENWELEFVPGNWVECLKRLELGEIDLMPDVAYTAERDRIFDFHVTPALSSWFQVYARKSSGINSLLDLKDKRVAVLESSVQQASFIAMAKSFDLNITIVTASDYEKVFTLVMQNKADAAVSNQFFGAMHARKYALEDTAVIFSPSALFYAAPEGRNRHYLQQIDQHLNELKQDRKSVYYQSVKRWTDEPVRFNIPYEVKLLLIVVLLFLGLSIAGSLYLKHQVNVRTLELQQSHAQLESRVLERTAELAEAMERAEEADRIKSAFLASMSHELRTPLNSIIGFTGILLQGLAGPLNEEQNKQLGMVQKSARHLLSLINDVLDISKIEAGQLNLAVSSFPLRASFEKIVMLMQPLASDKGLELNVEIADNVADLVTDQRRFEQIIINLLNNAIKFTEKGGVSLNCRFDNGNCLVEVRDTGIGMEESALAKIFEPFRQIDSGLARKHEGTGLGLSICKRLIEMMGGSIDVKSRLGQGSTFYISLPLKKGGENGEDIVDN